MLARNATSPLAGSGALAPQWHTLALIGLLLAVAVTGMFLGGGPAVVPGTPDPRARVAAVYLPMIIVQWGLLLYVCRIGRAGSALGGLLGRRWETGGRVAGDIALAAAMWLLILAVELIWRKLAGAGARDAAAPLLPHTRDERLSWVLLAVSAGFCEEVVYRGYLLTQLTAMTGRAVFAVPLQAVLFGLAHGEQGAGAVARATLYGVLLGALARNRRSLWPGILAHVWTDLASGILHA